MTPNTRRRLQRRWRGLAGLTIAAALFAVLVGATQQLGLGLASAAYNTQPDRVPEPIEPEEPVKPATTFDDINPITGLPGVPPAPPAGGSSEPAPGGMTSGHGTGTPTNGGSEGGGSGSGGTEGEPPTTDDPQHKGNPNPGGDQPPSQDPPLDEPPILLPDGSPSSQLQAELEKLGLDLGDLLDSGCEPADELPTSQEGNPKESPSLLSGSFGALQLSTT